MVAPYISTPIIVYLQKPKFDVGKLLDLHGEGTSSSSGPAKPAGGESGEKVDRPDNYEPPVIADV